MAKNTLSDDAAAEQAAAEAAAAEQAAAEAAAAEQAAAEAAAAEQAAALVNLGPGQVRVRFVQSHEVQDERRGTRFATVYSAGQEYALSEASAMHFVSRGKAVTI